MTYGSFSPRVLLVATALMASAAQACGPSVQLIYEGNMRFEHCYRLDFDEQIAPTHRRVCWVEWVDNYTHGQTRDRVEYAKRRVESLNRGEGAALAMHLDDPLDAGPPAVRADPAPIPTSAHAPPPAVSPPPAPSSSANPLGGVAGIANLPAGDAAPDAGAGPGTQKGRPRSAPGRDHRKKTKS